MTTANGMADATVSVMTPASIHGAPATRFQPSTHAAVHAHHVRRRTP